MTHPVIKATSVIGEALKSVADTNPAFMQTTDKATALIELARLEARLAELRLRILADAGDLAEQTAARDAAGWLSHQTRSRHEETRADLALAHALDRRYPVLATTLREGRANLAQARVIARALDNLPREVPADVLTRAEETLVAHAADLDPRQLGRLGRRIVELVAPELAEEAEARRLADLEAGAHRATRLTLRRCGDGTTRIAGLLPDASATRLATYLEAFTNPRKATDTPFDQTEHPGTDPVSRLPYPRRLGEAFCQLLETLDPARLPLHGGDATTLIVTVSLESLRQELGVAGLIGDHVPGEDLTGDHITAAEARRLACNARIIPAVLGGGSEVLDLGRLQRLFTAAQRRALLLRDRTCRAEGCDIPGTWAEAHHWLAWSVGGATDLDNAVLLCSHHHHRAHDPDHRVERLSNGDVRFSRRT